MVAFHARLLGMKGDHDLPKNEPKICAHIPCRCNVTEEQKYCGQWCEEAGSEDVEIACECGHSACALADAEETVA